MKRTRDLEDGLARPVEGKRVDIIPHSRCARTFLDGLKRLRDAD